MKTTSFILKETLGSTGDGTEFEVWKKISWETRALPEAKEESLTLIGRFQMQWQARLEMIRQIA